MNQPVRMNRVVRIDIERDLKNHAMSVTFLRTDKPAWIPPGQWVKNYSRRTYIPTTASIRRLECAMKATQVAYRLIGVV